jgi:hypothetical protein
MKTIMNVLGRVSLAVAFLIVFSHASVLGNMKAVPTDSFSITSADNSASSLVWDLKYAASENAFKITMSENKGEKEYTVRSKFFEVAYILNKNGFGARMVKPGKMQVPFEILNKIINQEALKNQKVISDSQINNETALNLIASYLPDLINENYKQLLQ